MEQQQREHSWTNHPHGTRSAPMWNTVKMFYWSRRHRHRFTVFLSKYIIATERLTKWQSIYICIYVCILIWLCSIKYNLRREETSFSSSSRFFSLWTTHTGTKKEKTEAKKRIRDKFVSTDHLEMSLFFNRRLTWVKERRSSSLTRTLIDRVLITFLFLSPSERRWWTVHCSSPQRDLSLPAAIG